VKIGDKEKLVCICLVKDCLKLTYYLENIRELEENMNTTLIIVRKELAPFRRFLRIACTNAINKFFSKQGIAKKLSIEILLNIAGTRQIKEAIRRVVPADESEALTIAILSRSENPLEILERLKGILKCGEICYRIQADQFILERIAEIYNISREEIECTYAGDFLEALEKCLILRTAMLYLIK